MKFPRRIKLKNLIKQNQGNTSICTTLQIKNDENKKLPNKFILFTIWSILIIIFFLFSLEKMTDNIPFLLLCKTGDNLYNLNLNIQKQKTKNKKQKNKKQKKIIIKKNK